MIRILPKPQHIEEQEGTLLLDYHCRITIEDRCPRESLFYAQQLAEQIKKMVQKYAQHKKKVFLMVFRRFAS